MLMQNFGGQIRCIMGDMQVVIIMSVRIKGEFSLSRNFDVRTRVNTIEAMYRGRT